MIYYNYGEQAASFHTEKLVVSNNSNSNDDKKMGSNRLKLHFGLAFAQICFAGFEILTRTALFDGANQLVFTFYRNILACLVLGPPAYYLERKNRPALSFSSIALLFSIGLLGVTINQLLYLVGLQYTSTVFASAMRNVTPIFTFVLAALLSVEEVNVKRRDGVAKLCGCLLGLAGAVLLSSYHPSVTSTSLVASSSTDTIIRIELFFDAQLFQITRWELGGICLILSFLSFAMSLILQSSLLQKFPAPLSIGALSCLFSTIQVGILALVFDGHNVSCWKLTTTEILIVIYAGVIGSGVVSGIQSWSVQKGGPVIVAAYQPLETVAVTIFYMVSGVSLYFNSFIGTVLVFCGLYLLTWGQEEQKRLTASSRLSSPDSESSTIDQMKQPLMASEDNC